MSTVLVAGAGGFVGSAIARRLVLGGNQALGRECNRPRGRARSVPTGRLNASRWWQQRIGLDCRALSDLHGFGGAFCDVLGRVRPRAVVNAALDAAVYSSGTAVGHGASRDPVCDAGCFPDGARPTRRRAHGSRTRRPVSTRPRTSIHARRMRSTRRKRTTFCPVLADAASGRCRPPAVQRLRPVRETNPACSRTRRAAVPWRLADVSHGARYEIPTTSTPPRRPSRRISRPGTAWERCTTSDRDGRRPHVNSRSPSPGCRRPGADPVRRRDASATRNCRRSSPNRALATGALGWRGGAHPRRRVRSAVEWWLAPLAWPAAPTSSRGDPAMTTCRTCKSDRLYLFLPLGDHPLANGFLREEQLDSPNPFPARRPRLP